MCILLFVLFYTKLFKIFAMAVPLSNGSNGCDFFNPWGGGHGLGTTKKQNKLGPKAARDDFKLKENYLFK